MTAKIDHGAVEAAKHGIARSPHWPSVEKSFKEQNPDCIYCGDDSGKIYGIQIHHIHPFHQVVGVGRADLELDPRNLCSLCETEVGKPAPDHHITCGHLGSFQRNNESVVTDVVTFKGQPQKLIEANTLWQEKEKMATKPFSEWTDDEKKVYRDKLDRELPPDVKILAKYFPISS